MTTADEAASSPILAAREESRALSDQWRALRRSATFVAILSAPAAFLYLWRHTGLSLGWAIVATAGAIFAFRGLLDLAFRRFIPWPSLFATDDVRMREEDVLNRRRAWFWHSLLKWAVILAVFISVVYLVQLVAGGDVTWWGTASSILKGIGHAVASRQWWTQAFLVLFLFLANFLIFMGPLMLMGISQIRGFEPGDANWGVKLEDVRGQAEAKEEVRRIVNLWQSGEAFEKAGGRRERGILFHGAPGTGKTMLAKAIATGFNSPFVSIPGSGFAQTFIGIDALIVRYLARKAKKLASKWGGQCIVFIDEIDAVGMRRASLGGATPTMSGSYARRYEDYAFYGPNGALNPTGDLILETKGWRDRLFVEREPPRPSPYPGWVHRLSAIVNQGVFPGMFGGMGQLALNQLLVTMDGIDNPPFWRRFWTNRINTLLDASYVVPRRLGKVPLRLPAPRPTGNQIYFIGATNVPLEHLDPALRRPGRMGRHVWFRTPTKHDREDIFELYLGKVAHDEELDQQSAREELARITNGYAQPLTVQLLTPHGWIRMGDVEVGDSLVGADGVPTRVVAVHPRGEMDVYRVKFNDGTSTECTADHLWTVEAADPRARPRTLTLGEIVERGLRWSPGGSRFYLPKLAPVQTETTEELPIDPYLLGLLLGDGGFTSTTPDFCTADEENLVAVGALSPAGVSPVRHGPMNWWLSSGGRGGVQRGRVNTLTMSLAELGLWGVRGRGKFVPEPYKWASSQERLSILQGLMDTDGCRDYRRGTGAEFYSHSRRLAEDVAFLARSLGGSARIRVKRDGWRVAVDLPDGMVPFRLERKAAQYRASRRPFRKCITSVEHVGREVVQCVTVAASDGLYVTDGFTVTHNSPAMIEQVCSMALTHAHHDGREQFTREDIVEAMTTVESGTAIGVEYVPEETRAVAIHEAGHAATAHVFLKGVESTRISIRMRAGSLGHHQALEKEERFSSWKHEEMGKLAWTLGALAAEHVFYGENATGVGGDLQSATGRAAWMVGVSGMGPDPVELNGRPRSAQKRDEEKEKIQKRFEKIGLQLMNRASGDFQHDAIASVLGDPTKRALAAQIIGQAYLEAYNLVGQNKEAVEKIADTLVARRELYGNELIDLLNSVGLKEPEYDLTKEESWPTL
jgi:ATP-dependent Zn protease